MVICHERPPLIALLRVPTLPAVLHLRAVSPAPRYPSRRGAPHPLEPPLALQQRYLHCPNGGSHHPPSFVSFAISMALSLAAVCAWCAGFVGCAQLLSDFRYLLAT